MYDICCVGHITLDKVVTPQLEVHMAGGTSFYFSNAIRQMDVQYLLVTALGQQEMYITEQLQAKGIAVQARVGGNTVYFENIYADNQDHRTQRVQQKADAFTADQLQDIQARIFHLGPLLADDIPVSLIRDLSLRSRVSLDVQGYLREVRAQAVFPIDWPAKKEALQYVHTLKANEAELKVLTGDTDVHAGARILAEWGVQEVVITLGSMGSVLYAGNTFYTIPAYTPASGVADATGCGDTYMAGYLSQRVKGVAVPQAGAFASAMAGLKTASSGPFTGTREDVLQFLSFRN